jgi:sensor domain CHASE-containing protein
MISLILLAEQTANIPWWFWGLLVGLIGVLVSIIGFLVKYILDNQKQDKDSQKQTNEKLFDLVENQRSTSERLNSSISSLDKTMALIQQHTVDFEKEYGSHKEVCNYKLEDLKKK